MSAIATRLRESSHTAIHPIAEIMPPGQSAIVSRSKHQTRKSVFGGRPASEINDMLVHGDHDAMELVAKGRIKRTVKKARRASSTKDERPLPV